MGKIRRFFNRISLGAFGNVYSTLNIKLNFMSKVEEIAKDFAFDFNNNSYSVEAVQDILDEKLRVFRKDGDKLIFLRYLRERTIKDKLKHEEKGPCPEWCGTHKEKENALFILDQEIAAINKYFEPEIPLENRFTSEEENNLFSTLNEMLRNFDELKAGHAVLFNEIDDLKQHFNLDRKSWTDLAAGRVFRLAKAGVLETDDAKEILKSLGKALIEPINIFIK